MVVAMQRRVVGSSTVTGGPAATYASSPGAGRAEALLWLAFAFFLAGVGIGTGWDRRWHASHAFEDFWSPPHLFIYTNVLLAAAIVVHITFNSRVRAAFGSGQSLRPFPFRVPGALMLLGAGFVVIGLGGMLDGVWHTSFGLDETNWSLPHAMLGRGILLAALGFASARLALPRTMHWLAAGVLAWVILNVALDLVGGPILRNPPPEALRAIARLPVLANDPAFQHTTRIYLAAHLDRTNWLYLPMIAFTVGVGLRLVQRLTGPRDRWLIAVSALGVAIALVDREGPSVWAGLLLAPPFLPAALGYTGARRLGPKVRALAWIAAAWAACAASLIWVANPVLAIACGPLGLVGAWVAARLLQVIDSPTRRSMLTAALLIGLVLPILTGALDLYWRTHIP
jgi:hypothetical protein